MSTWTKVIELYENAKFVIAERKRRKQAEKGRSQIVSAENADSSDDELTTPTSASSFDAEHEALMNPLSGKEALSKYFGFLGASRFRDAAQLCRVHYKAINGTLPLNAWQGGKGEPFHKSLLAIVKAEKGLGSFNFTFRNNKSLLQLRSMYSTLLKELEAASTVLTRSSDFVEIRGVSVPIESVPEEAGQRESRGRAAQWIEALQGLMHARIALVQVLQLLSAEESLTQPKPLIDLLAPFEMTQTFATSVGGHTSPLTPSPSPDAGGEEDADWSRVLAPFRERAQHETNMLIALLRVQECCFSYDFLGMSIAIFMVHKTLMKLAHAIELAGGGVEGGTTVISEWWTQMDGYWGANTTRAVQQYINARRERERGEGGAEGADVVVDGNFGPKTISALQRYLNREREALGLHKDGSMRGNAPKPGSGSTNVMTLLQRWPELPINGSWNRETKTAMQAFLRQKVPSASFNVDGRFHKKSSQALQMFLAKEEWYRPALHNLSNVHQTRISMHSLNLHRWLCALKEGLVSNASFVFHNVIAEKEHARTTFKEMSVLSQRMALPYLHVIEEFVQKQGPKHVLLVVDGARTPNFSLKGYAPPTSSGQASIPAEGGAEMAILLAPVFSHPALEEETRQRHWPTLIAHIEESRRSLQDIVDKSARGDLVQCVYEAKLNTTYFVHPVDNRVAFVVLFDGKRKKEGNGVVLRFIHFIIEGMSCSNVVGKLKEKET